MDWPKPPPPSAVAVADLAAFFGHRAWATPQGGDAGERRREYFAVKSKTLAVTDETAAAFAASPLGPCQPPVLPRPMPAWCTF